MATIEEVAAKAGVSIATVSRVMNNSYIVSPEKRERVLAVARELNYQTNRSSARQADNRLILLAGSAMLYGVMSGMQDKARENGFDVIYSYANCPQNGLKTIGLINRGLVDGIILMNYRPEEHELDELAARLPIVECGGTRKIPGCPSVSVNNERAAAEMVSHLAGLGRRRIGMVLHDDSPLMPDYFHERQKGYQSAMLEHGLTLDPGLVFRCDLSPESIAACVSRMLSLAQPPNALFCLTDRIAAALLIELRSRGVAVPEQIAIGGFDNDDLSEMLRPPLTTIAQPFYEIGCECVRVLLAQIKDDNYVGRQVLLSHSLIVRESTAGTAI